MPQQAPLVALYVVTDVNLFQAIVEVYVKFEAVVGPRTELHIARLLVEREVGDVDGAGGLEDGHGDPEHGAVARHDGHRLALLLETRVRAAKQETLEFRDGVARTKPCGVVRWRRGITDKRVSCHCFKQCWCLRWFCGGAKMTASPFS